MKKTQSMIMGSAMAALASSAMHRVFGAYAVQSAITQSMKAGRKLEARSKYMPHQGEREVGRRLRQAERDNLRQRQRANDLTMTDNLLHCAERMSRRRRPIAQTA